VFKASTLIQTSGEVIQHLSAFARDVSHDIEGLGRSRRAVDACTDKRAEPSSGKGCLDP
jgi:hypothetical protein